MTGDTARERRGFSLRRAEAITDSYGKRHCANCGDFIDPVDWCPGCRQGAPCQAPHQRLRKLANAAFCNAACRAHHRYTYVRDCL